MWCDGLCVRTIAVTATAVTAATTGRRCWPTVGSARLAVSGDSRQKKIPVEQFA